MNTKNLTLRPLNDNDIPLFTSWLQKDYIKKWYHDTEDWLAEINGRHSTYSWIHHFIVTDGKTPVGFCQYYDCFHAHNMEEWYCVSDFNDTFSIDYLIGNEAYLGKGYGKEIVRMITAKIQQTEAANRIIVQPDAENTRSNNVLLANGYAFDTSNNYYYKQLR